MNFIVSCEAGLKLAKESILGKIVRLKIFSSLGFENVILCMQAYDCVSARVQKPAEVETILYNSLLFMVFLILPVRE